MAAPQEDLKSPDVENKESSKVNLDSILKEVGGFGKFQLRTIFLTVIIGIFMAWGASEYVFTTARINARCLIPECDTANPAYSVPWILNAVPGTSATSFDGCNRFANSSSSVAPPANTCPATLFDQNQIVECESYVYENTDSVVYDLELPCDEWSRTLIGSIRTVGTLTALPITGYVSDTWGRRTALTLNAFNTAWIGFTRYWANTYVGFVISEFAEATFGSGGFSCAYILVMEVVGPKYRVASGATMNTSFSVGQILMGLIAWGVPNWRNLTLALYVPQLITISYFWIMTESVRWYMSKGRYVESEKVLKQIAKVNGKTLSDESLKSLRNSYEEEKKIQELEKTERAKEPWLIVLVFKHKPILIRCLISPIWWITNTFIYYGMTINSVNLSGNRYFNYMATSAAQIPGYWTAVILIEIVGRKPVLIGAYWLCAACQIAYIFLPTDLYALSLTMYLISTYASAIIMTSVYVYTAELYPTKYRHSLFGYSSMMGRIGSILAPLTPALGALVWENLPFALFASFALLSGALIFFTPETLGTEFPDTMEEASHIGKKKNTT